MAREKSGSSVGFYCIGTSERRPSDGLSSATCVCFSGNRCGKRSGSLETTGGGCGGPYVRVRSIPPSQTLCLEVSGM